MAQDYDRMHPLDTAYVFAFLEAKQLNESKKLGSPLTRTNPTLLCSSFSPERPTELFRGTIIAAAAAIVIMHKPPSGEPTPSEADIKVTRAINDQRFLATAEQVA